MTAPVHLLAAANGRAYGPAALRGGHESAGAVQTGLCCGRVSRAAAAGWLQGRKLGEAAVTPETLLQDPIDSAWQSGRGVRWDLMLVSCANTYYAVWLPVIAYYL